MNTVLIASLVALSPVGDLSPKMKEHAASIAAAPGLSVQYKVTTVGGTSVEYDVKLAKPNLARIEAAGKVWTADGQNVTVYDKASNSYTVEEQKPGAVWAMLDGPETALWGTFFDAKGVENLASSKDLGKKKLRGSEYDAVGVVVDPGATLTATMYLDAADMMPRIVEFTQKTGASSVSKILDVKAISLDAVESSMFAFAPPSGAKKVDIAASTGVWLHDLDEALKLAGATGKKVIVDFMASWCGPCKLMDAEVFQSERFKQEAKDFVLCKIDVDEQKAVAQRYNIEAMPTVKFLKADGSVVHEFVGYANPDQVFREIATARSK